MTLLATCLSLFVSAVDVVGHLFCLFGADSPSRKPVVFVNALNEVCTFLPNAYQTIDVICES